MFSLFRLSIKLMHGTRKTYSIRYKQFDRKLVDEADLNSVELFIPNTFFKIRI